MKQLHLIALTAMSAFMTAGCASLGPNAGANGLIYNDTTLPNYAAPTAGDATVGPRTGEATTHDVLGLVSWGDAGTLQAARNGGVTQIKTIDVGTYSILGLYAERTTKVGGFGEVPSPRYSSKATYQLHDAPYTVFNDY